MYSVIGRASNSRLQPASRYAHTASFVVAASPRCGLLCNLFLLPIVPAVNQSIGVDSSQTSVCDARQNAKNQHSYVQRMVYVGNVNAREMRNAGEIARDLAGNIAHGVRWYEATTVLQELSCSLFIEMPPGRVLTGLAKESIPQVRSIALAESSLSYVVQQAFRHWF